MSNLQFSKSEFQVATAALAITAALLPAYYFLCKEPSQESTSHLKTFRRYLNSYTTLRPTDLVSTASPNFNHVVLPESLNIPVRNLDNFQNHAHMIFSLFSTFWMIPVTSEGNDGVHLSRATNTVVAHCKMGGKVNGKSEKGRLLVKAGYEEWWTETVLMVRMSEDGNRVEEVREFVDGAKAAELQKKLSGVLSN